MQPISRCDVCGRPAKYHETSLAEGSSESRHLCGIHGRKNSVAACKDVLLPLVESWPEDWLQSDVPLSELRRQITEASTMQEIARILRFGNR